MPKGAEVGLLPDRTVKSTASRLPTVRTLALAVAVAGGVLLLLLAARPLLFGEPRFFGTAYDPPMPAPEFALVDHEGNEARLQQFRGRPVLLFFGYTHCPDVCPLTLSALTRALRAEGTDLADVQVLLVTVDPERDTPAALNRYVHRFGPHVSGLTGEADVLQRLRSEFGAYAGPGHGAARHTMGHTDAVFGIDRQGRLRVLIHPDAPPEHLRHDLRALARL